LINFISLVSGYSIALEKLIRLDERGEDLLIGLLEEEIIRATFNIAPAKDDISFFCYLLIDPSTLLPNPSFRDFILAIFYAGKGKRSRPLCHFFDSVKHRLNPKGQVSNLNAFLTLIFDSFQPSKKISRILNLWDNQTGVISLHLFNNIHSAEALIREGCIIEAIGRSF
jgi:hypothetical protein